MLDWLDRMQERLGAERISLSPAEIEALLALARAASHESGERTNAPLATYLVGVAHARPPGSDLEELVAAALGRTTSAAPDDVDRPIERG